MITGNHRAGLPPGQAARIRLESENTPQKSRLSPSERAFIVVSCYLLNTCDGTSPLSKGGTRGPCIGHVSPEAAAGGLIGLVEDGDTIGIDIPDRTLTLRVEEEEIQRRRRQWSPIPPKISTGYLARYPQMVTSAATGAVYQTPNKQ